MVTLTPIGLIYSCYKEKFGIPRQSGLVPHSKGELHFETPFNREEALRGLEEFSHCIITFIPHLADKERSVLSVRPPRLGGNKKTGVFATRSPFRPNPLCTSVVKIDSVDFQKGILHFSNHDILNMTPVVDVKPYIPQWDSLPHAHEGWLKSAPEESRCRVHFDESLEVDKNFKLLLEELLSLNPRPRYQEGERDYAFKVEEFDVHFRYLSEDQIEVFKLQPLN